MSDISRSSRITTAVAVAAIGFAACEAFAPQQPSVRTLGAATSSSRSQESLLSRYALFGLIGKTDEATETAETTEVATQDAKKSVMNVFSYYSKSNMLIEKTKVFIDDASGFYSDSDETVFAEDFVFRGPFIGPLNKKDYIGTMEAFSIFKSFPDIQNNAWGFSTDPLDPNRVWFMVRNTGTFTGDPLLPDLLNVLPTGAKLEGCPETFSVVFDDEQKVKHLTVGYVADRFEGNTDGLGAAFGIFKVIGAPTPKPGPLLQVLQWAGSELADSYPKSYSTDVPAWYFEEKGPKVGCDGY